MKSVVLYPLISVIICSSIFYARSAPPVAVVTTEVRTYTATIIHGVVVIRDVFVVKMSLTTTISTSTVVQREEELQIKVYPTIYVTLTDNYQATTTSWSKYLTTATQSVRTTKYQTFAETYPILWIILPATIVGVLLIAQAYEKPRR
jgi:hypothetical protein